MIFKKWINRTFGDPNALTGADVPYDGTKSLNEEVDLKLNIADLPTIPPQGGREVIGTLNLFGYGSARATLPTLDSMYGGGAGDIYQDFYRLELEVNTLASESSIDTNVGFYYNKGWDVLDGDNDEDYLYPYDISDDVIDSGSAFAMSIYLQRSNYSFNQWLVLPNYIGGTDLAQPTLTRFTSLYETSDNKRTGSDKTFPLTIPLADSDVFGIELGSGSRVVDKGILTLYGYRG